jgi:hypothetical protein
MLESPDAILIYIPLMKGLGMSWREVKHTPRIELEALLQAMYEYDTFHSMDGYTDKEVADMAKNKPEVRQQYHRYLETRRKFEEMVGKTREVNFGGLIE